MTPVSTLPVALLLVLALTLPGDASVIVNGDFETAWTTGTPPGWSVPSGYNNPAAPQSAPNAISGATSALFSASGRLAQAFTALSGVPSRFQLDFAAEDLSSETNPENLRSLNLGLFYDASYTDGSVPRVHLRVNGVGDLQVYSGSWFTPSGLAGAVSLDTDVTTSPVVNRLAVTSFGQLPVPLYQIQVTDATNNVAQSALLRRHEPNAPGTGDAWQAVQFRTDISAGDYLADNATLAEVAWTPPIAILAQHSGNTNPLAQGWSLGASGSSVGAVTDDAQTGIDAWQIDSGDTNRTFYRKDLTVPEATVAMDRGWQINAVLRVTDTDNAPDNTRWISFVTPGDSTTGKEFALNFGSDASGNALVQFHNTAETYSLGDRGYHLFSMMYDPDSASASLFIDGSETPALSGYSGFAKNAVFGSDTFVRFGSVNTWDAGAANYHFVQFAIIPEPGSLAMLAVAVAALLVGRPRRR